MTPREKETVQALEAFNQSLETSKLEYDALAKTFSDDKKALERKIETLELELEEITQDRDEINQKYQSLSARNRVHEWITASIYERLSKFKFYHDDRDALIARNLKNSTRNSLPLAAQITANVHFEFPQWKQLYLPKRNTTFRPLKGHNGRVPLHETEIRSFWRLWGYIIHGDEDIQDTGFDTEIYESVLRLNNLSDTRDNLMTFVFNCFTQIMEGKKMTENQLALSQSSTLGKTTRGNKRKRSYKHPPSPRKSVQFRAPVDSSDDDECPPPAKRSSGDSGLGQDSAPKTGSEETETPDMDMNSIPVNMEVSSIVYDNGSGASSASMIRVIIESNLITLTGQRLSPSLVKKETPSEDSRYAPLSSD